ncbi:MerR family transcriptional regulator [Neopusillimonas aromaticivorans]|uniref:MerR family transcriptional regulator n=1 Tax=Neopusillimonas aromaticivorans TaxID=2979868 RepID=UPI003D9E3099
MNAPGGQVISTREAADRLGVSVRTVQLWVESGVLDAWKTPGGHRRIPLARTFHQPSDPSVFWPLWLESFAAKTR